MNRLPIDDILPELIDTLREHPCVVLEAPPGAGKSTRVPPALLDAGFAVGGQIWMLEPRRVAARAVATRIAQERKEALGQQVGYAVRFDRKASDRTELLVVTEGLLLRRLLDDPFLEGIQCVILDEFHERSLDVDLCLAMLKEVLTIRDDLRVVVMSATLQSDQLAAYLDAPVITSQGRMFPVEMRYLEQPEDDIVHSAIHTTVTALAEDEEGGDVLVFMPGKREIQQTIAGLTQKIDASIACLPLHGSLSLDEQMRAIAPSTQRRVIVSTNIAETSLTVEGVTAVVDSGKVKQLVATPSGLDQLVLQHISLASAKQRAGRAGRVRPGRAYKLWTRAQDQFLDDFDAPDVARVDVTSALLQVLAWSSQSPAEFDWFDSPSSSAIHGAVSLLRQMHALPPDGWALTPHGQVLMRLPLHPRLGQLIAVGKQLDVVEDCLLAAALLSETDLSKDVPSSGAQACEVFEAMHNPRARARHHVKRQVQQLRRATASLPKQPTRHQSDPKSVRFQRALMLTYPDRLCMKRADDRYLMDGQHPVKLARHSKVQRAPWLVAVSLHGQVLDRNPQGSGTTTRGLVRLASVVEIQWLRESFPERWDERVAVRFDARLGRVSAVAQTCFDDVIVEESPMSLNNAPIDEQEVARLLAKGLSEDLHRGFKLDRDDKQLLDRMVFLHHWMPDLQLPLLTRHPPEEGRDEATMAMLMQWCWGKRALQDLKRASLKTLLRQGLTHPQWQALSKHAPATYQIPSRSHIHLDYSDPTSPVLAARIQELFGLLETPTLAHGRVQVTMHLLAPNYRAAQVTQDLHSFWVNTYAEVRKELRARYPKHPWPEDPLTARAIRK